MPFFIARVKENQTVLLQLIQYIQPINVQKYQMLLEQLKIIQTITFHRRFP